MTNLIFVAMMIAESSGNRWAVGDNGMSYGPLQISVDYYRDACDMLKAEGRPVPKWPDVFDYDQSVILVQAYMRRYCNAARLGRQPRVRDMLRIHNGGPTGFRKRATLAYVRKVSARYKALFGTDLDLNEEWLP